MIAVELRKLLISRRTWVTILLIDALPTLVAVPVNPSMSAAGARASTAFFSRFDAGGTHAGWLTPGELRLIAEWLDIGGQYYNDPFMAPVN